MTTLKGRNEGVEYIHGMVNQRESTGMEYPSDTNMRGNAKAVSGSEGDKNNSYQRHAAGDVVESDEKAMGGLPGGRFGGPRSGAMRGPQPMKCGGKMKRG